LDILTNKIYDSRVKLKDYKAEYFEQKACPFGYFLFFAYWTKSRLLMRSALIRQYILVLLTEPRALASGL